MTRETGRTINYAAGAGGLLFLVCTWIGLGFAINQVDPDFEERLFMAIIISLLLGISVTCFTLMQVTGTDPRFFDQEEYEW